jgi:adenosylmethionine-8-amino-7-oxononanoate aminotransferase
MPSVPGYLKAMRKVCDHHDVLLIFDEVMCGMGRSGTLHAWEQEDAIPDLQVVGKGMAGGFEELSAVFLSRKIADAIETGSGYFNHGHTFQNWSPACAAGLEVLKIVQEKRLPQNASEKGILLLKLLKEAVGDHEYVGDVRGRGLLIGVSLPVRSTSELQLMLQDRICFRQIHERSFRTQRWCGAQTSQKRYGIARLLHDYCLISSRLGSSP